MARLRKYAAGNVPKASLHKKASTALFTFHPATIRLYYIPIANPLSLLCLLLCVSNDYS